MTDEFELARSRRLESLYGRYRHELNSTPVGGRWMPYRWWTLPNTLQVNWMAFSQMLDDYATELANIVNDLTHNVHRMRAWATITAGLDADGKLEASHEFIDMLGTVAMGQPYAIKSRFAVAAGHLCHQANQAADGAGWKDDFPSKNLYLNDIEPFCAGWKRYRAFKRKVEPIAGGSFKEASDDFRNSYNHGFSSRFLIGMSGTVERVSEAGSTYYAFGGNEPLDIGDMARLLEKERDLCYLAFDAFQLLVGEMTDAIAAIESGGSASTGGRAAETPTTGALLAFDPDTGVITSRGKKIGAARHSAGRTTVSFELTYTTEVDEWILPLSWLAYGLRLAGTDEPPPALLEVASGPDDVEEVEPSGPTFLIEKTLRKDGHAWRFHKSDADHWPSPLHGHDYENGLVIDGITGRIYDKATKTEVKRLKSKPLAALHEEIRASKDLAPIAARHLPPPAPQP